jgi:hypothetical protein
MGYSGGIVKGKKQFRVQGSGFRGKDSPGSRVQRGKAVSAYRRKTTIVIPGFTQ